VRNPAAISRSQMDAWVAEGVVEYWGTSEDVRTEIARADCVVLPSYREGTPRALLEAAAMSRPLITTDAVGCREVVDDGDNGYLCQVRSVDSLVACMGRMVDMDITDRIEMGKSSRLKISKQFDEAFVVGAYLTTIRRLIS